MPCSLHTFQTQNAGVDNTTPDETRLCCDWGNFIGNDSYEINSSKKKVLIQLAGKSDNLKHEEICPDFGFFYSANL